MVGDRKIENLNFQINFRTLVARESSGYQMIKPAAGEFGAASHHRRVTLFYTAVTVRLPRRDTAVSVSHQVK